MKNILAVAVLIVFGTVLLQLVTGDQKKVADKTYSDFLNAVEGGLVKEVEITMREEGADIVYALRDSSEKQKTYTPSPDSVIPMLREKKVDIVAKPVPEETFLAAFVAYWLPILILIGFLVFFMRQVQAGNGRAMAFGKSKARLLNENSVKVTFNDVSGCEEAKNELIEIIEFLKDPKKFQRLGGRIPKGVLLVGPPGTGKTLLARAVAGEASVPFFSISGSDFVEMFVGVGAARVRDLFIQGKRHAPCIIFIDEIDAVGRHRGAGLGGGHDEREQTLNQLLVEMDGFESNEGLIMIAATNRPDVLDPALLRPGRFDRRVIVPRPDVRGREGILEVHSKRVTMGDNVELSVIARSTPGFSGADLMNLVNEAALIAARRGKDQVEMEDFEYAKDKVLMGVERRSMVIDERDRRRTAYHEAGHALVGMLTKDADPIHKVTIIPRGMAMGLTVSLPEKDRTNLTKSEINAMLQVLMGGRAAEELVFEEVSTGAGNDLERATGLARKMVCEWGMSEKLGPLTFGRPDDEIFLGREISRRQDYSEQTAVTIDDEVHEIVQSAYDVALTVLKGQREFLERAAQALLDRETVDAKDLELLRNDEPLPPLRVVPPLDQPRDAARDASAEESKDAAKDDDSERKAVGV